MAKAWGDIEHTNVELARAWRIVDEIATGIHDNDVETTTKSLLGRLFPDEVHSRTFFKWIRYELLNSTEGQLLVS